MAESPLKTCWAKDVSPENALPEYPRPQMVRRDWKNLNGLWELEITSVKNGLPENFSSKILVPYPVESALSGIGKRVDETERIWYRRIFKIPSKWNKKRILLHFGAIDWESEVFIDGHKLGLHRGGYDAFCYDITDALSGKKDHEIIVGVWDPSDQGSQAHGKQKKNPRRIFYTPTSGVWQTVWLEPVSDVYIKDIKIFPDVDGGRLRLKAEIEGHKDGKRIKCEAFSDGASIADFTGLPGEETILSIPDARLWSPEDPYLYDFKLSLLDEEGKILDMIDSYFAMRKTSLGKDEKGITRLLLNNKFIFQLGPLDQGFWPDGLYTAPTDTALRYDIEVMKEMGFNMVRKHVKIEPDRWYYWCDRLGLLVWQDMPNAKNSTAEEKAQFELELERLILGRFNHPSIIMWVPFNEGWGQYDSARITEKIKDMDPTRLVNHASGWHDQGVSDIHDVHSYPDPKCPYPEETRAAVLGEFGGLGFNVTDHTWKEEGWGYDLLQNPEGLVRRYENLMANLLPMVQSPGLSAAVYTQITDIETENNGLLTYDRAVNKMGADTVALANAGYLPPQLVSDTFIFIKDFSVKLECFKPDAEIRYTIDGSKPDKKSLLYKEPFKITKSVELKAAAFWPDGNKSRISCFELKKVELKNVK